MSRVRTALAAELRARVAQAFSAHVLTPAEADTYVAQAGVAAELLGVVDPPTSVAGMQALLAQYRPELEATAQAREAARFLLGEPPLPIPARPGYWAIAAGGVSLLEPWSREMLRLPSSALLARGFLRPLGWASAGTVRWAMASAGS